MRAAIAVGVLLAISSPYDAMAGGPAGGVRVLELTGTAAPGGVPSTVQSFLQSTINSEGDVAILGLLSDNKRAVWVHTQSDRLSLAYQAAPLPTDLGSGIWDVPTSIGLSNVGTVSILGGVVRSNVHRANAVITSYTNGLSYGTVTERYSAELPTVPGTSVSYQQMTQLTANGGSMALTSLVEIPNRPTNSMGLWRGTPAGASRIMQTGEAIPGNSPLNDPTTTSQYRINSTGDVLFVAENSLTSFDYGIWIRRSNGDMSTVIRRGDTIPGGQYGNISNSDVAFNDQLQWAVVTTINNSGTDAIIRAFGGTPNVVRKEGDLVPGLPGNNARITRFQHMTMGPQGAIVFTAETINDSGSVRTPLFLDIPGQSLIKVISDKETPIGVPASVVVTRVNGAAMNGTGRVAVSLELNVFGTTTSAGSGVWVRELDGSFVPVIVPGDVISLPDGSFGTVSRAGTQAWTTGQDGKLRGFNDRGEMLCQVTFQDFRTALVVVQVPSMGAGMTATASGLFFAARRRRRL